jgi:hypothetical protein
MAYTTINKGSSYFNTILYTGTGSSNARTGVGFQPDWVWIKGRSGATDHGLYDVVRGVQNQIESNTDTAQTTEATGLTAFGTDGFTVGALAQLNTSAATYVAWNWLANGAGVSNTAGTIASTVSANPTAGFSIVSYTGNASSGATIGHGLGVAPKMIIVKRLSGNTEAWPVDARQVSGILYLNETSTKGSYGAIEPFVSTAPTSTVFSLGSANNTNANTSPFIAYCFAEVKGYSKFGSYTGNGNANGTFIYTGFKPAFIIIKRTDVAQSWILFDNKRDPYNEATKVLYPNLSNAEDANNLDLLSNGFKPRSTSSFTNSSGNNFIYMAFAENPFVSSTLIPTTAR